MDNQVTTFNGITFSYVKKLLDEVEYFHPTDQHKVVYSGITILESSHPHFKVGDTLHQIQITNEMRYRPYPDER